MSGLHPDDFRDMPEPHTDANRYIKPNGNTHSDGYGNGNGNADSYRNTDRNCNYYCYGDTNTYWHASRLRFRIRLLEKPS